MHNLEVYFPQILSSTVTDLWRVRLENLSDALRKEGIKTSFADKNTTLPKTAILHLELNQSGDLKNLEWVSQAQVSKKILSLNKMVWMRNKNVIAPHLKSFDQVFMESDSSVLPAGVNDQMIPLAWMQLSSLASASQDPSVVGLALEPFVEGLPFERSLEDTDWNFFSVNERNGNLTVHSFEGTARARKKGEKDPVESNDLLRLALSAKALLFKNLGDKFDFLFLEFLSRSGKVLVDESCDLPPEFQSRVLQDKLSETDNQRECLGQALNDFDLNNQEHKVVTIEERAKELARFYKKN